MSHKDSQSKYASVGATEKAQQIPLAVPPLPRKYLCLTAGRGASRTNLLVGVLGAKGEANRSLGGQAGELWL